MHIAPSVLSYLIFRHRTYFSLLVFRYFLFFSCKKVEKANFSTFVNDMSVCVFQTLFLHLPSFLILLIIVQICGFAAKQAIDRFADFTTMRIIMMIRKDARTGVADFMPFCVIFIRCSAKQTGRAATDQLSMRIVMLGITPKSRPTFADSAAMLVIMLSRSK